jgi:hypothetical protein
VWYKIAYTEGILTGVVESAVQHERDCKIETIEQLDAIANDIKNMRALEFENLQRYISDVVVTNFKLVNKKGTVNNETPAT